MTPIIVLFNLKAGVTPESYEAWAKSTDLPIVRGLKSIGSFDVYKTKGLLRGGDPGTLSVCRNDHGQGYGRFRAGRLFGDDAAGCR